MRAALSRLADSQKDAPILFAYEPVWAIGADGIPASSDYADGRQAEIIAVAKDMLGRRVPCLYGGSVDADNCEAFIGRQHVDGLFIGRSAWKVEGYLDILGIRAAEQSSADIDVIAHQTDTVKNWMKASREKGLKSALTERDRPFAKKAH